jgi:nucleoside-diphosphate-sugar epimerase
VPVWISLCPLWVTVELLDWLDSAGVEQLAAVSSTSLVTKHRSGDPAERQLAARLARAEEALFNWAERRGVIATVLRPTMIYDGRSDNNVSAIAAWVRRCGWFPLCGSAEGLRQPVHADDVASVRPLRRERNSALDRHPVEQETRVNLAIIERCLGLLQ